MLDISVLEKAIDRLSEGLERYRQDISDTQIRDGLIQRIEFSAGRIASVMPLARADRGHSPRR